MMVTVGLKLTPQRRYQRACLEVSASSQSFALSIPALRGFGAAPVPAQLHSEAEALQRLHCARSGARRSGAASPGGS
ncbi:hypothetical protein B0B52_18095 [Polaromonas sp. A23]|nr:hypothetical protein B0B52_18095 [Polaromonas sp. A23]